MTIYGEGSLGAIVLGDNVWRYQLQWSDLLWLGRMLMGEPKASAPPVEWAGLLWCYTQRNANLRKGAGSGIINDRQAGRIDCQTDSNFAAYVRLHSQPINPKWQRDGYFCRVGGPRHGTNRCSPETLERRDRKASLTWNEISSAKREMLINWARAQVANPIPGYVDFAAGPSPNRPQGWLPNSSVRNGPAPFYGGLQLHEGGNVFYKQVRGPARRITTNWPQNFVRIEYNNTQSTETTPENVAQTLGPGRTVRETRAAQPENNIFVREHQITSERREVPGSSYPYWTVSSSFADSQSQTVMTADEEERVIQTNYERFYDQLNSLKSVSNLELAQAVPVLQIKTQDENGEIVNLNKLIFGKSLIQEYLQEDSGEFSALPFRPIASIVSLSFKVETPSVGGPTGIQVGNLSLKIHNPSKIHEDHPRGKFIAWMMRQGFYMRIKYGVIGPDSSNLFSSEDLVKAFQWKEQDFFVAQHDININDDKTYDLKLTIMPAAHKLLNQIHIGESIPFSDLATDGPVLTEEDFDNIFQTITADASSQEEIDEMRRGLQRFFNTFNQGRPSAGYRLIQNRERDGTVTIGSVLHGAIAQSRILDSANNQQSVVVENMVDALRSVQSILLTRRIESLLQEDSYLANIKGVVIPAINLGPLIFRLVVPEFEQVVRYTSQNNLQAGEIFSSDYHPETDSTERRTNVRLVFGNFNRWAGQWADKPISSFPISANAIFSYLREQRDVGQFSSTVNAFITRLNTLVNEPANFVVERQPNDDNDSPTHPIERPQIKYIFYPDPVYDNSWILYLYDNKVPMVRFSEMLRALNEADSIISREEIIERLDHLKIPWIEMGERGSLIKNMTARTQSDDRLMAHNMLRANQNAISSREIDGSLRIPAGISSEFMAGAQNDPQRIIRSTTLVLPIEVTITSYMLTTAFLFAPIYVFFPSKMFEGLYMPYVVEEEVKDGHAQTRMTLQVNITRANRSSSG